MHILLVDNTNTYPSLLAKSFSANEVTVVPWHEIGNVEVSNFDCAVLSGSSNFPVTGNEDEMSDELALIQTATFPILGICYGFELVVVAFGCRLKMMPKKEQGVSEMTVLNDDPILRGIEKLFVYEGHRWVADSLPDSLIPLAKSAHGIEGVRHKTRLVY